MKIASVTSLSAVILSIAATTAEATTCREIQRKWTITVSGDSVGARGKWTNEALTDGKASDLQTFQVKFAHNAPSNPCSGPTPALPTMIDLNANIGWNGALSPASTATGATTTFDLTVAGSDVPIPDQVLTDASVPSRGFDFFKSHSFSTGVNSSFDIFGLMGVKDIVRNDPNDDALVDQGFSVTVNPRSRSGFVKYMVPVPVPASLALGLSGVLALAGLRSFRRSRHDV